MEGQKHNDDLVLAEVRNLKELYNEKFSKIEEYMREGKDLNKDFHKRISLIEIWQANSLGKLTMISVAVGVGISVFVGWISSHLKT